MVTPSAVLEYHRGRLRDANTKGLLRATKLSAPPGIHASAITKLSNRVHRKVLNAESHVACVESLTGAFGILASATTAPGLWKCFLNALYVRKVDVISIIIYYATRPGNGIVTMYYYLQCVYPHDGLVLPLSITVSVLGND